MWLSGGSRLVVLSAVEVKLRLNWDLIGKHNTIGGAPRDIVKFCDDHEPLSFDAIYLRACSDPVLLQKAMLLLKTGGVLAIRFAGGDPALTSRKALDKMLSAVFESRWWLYFCRDDDVVWTRLCRQQGQSDIPWEDLPLAHYMGLLRRNVPFSFLRYSDGEWCCILKTIYPGPGQQKFTEKLCEDLLVSLVDYHKDPRYFMALQPRHHLRDSVYQWELIAAFLRQYQFEAIKWVSSGAFNHASELGNLWPFVQHLQQHNTLIVGPPRYRALQKLFPRAAFVVVPASQCHTQLAAIRENVLAQSLPAVILISAGPACKPLIHGLFKEIGDSSTMIDIGSMWAPYIGKAEHLVHLRMTPEIMARNVGELP